MKNLKDRETVISRIIDIDFCIKKNLKNARGPQIRLEIKEWEEKNQLTRKQEIFRKQFS